MCGTRASVATRGGRNGGDGHVADGLLLVHMPMLCPLSFRARWLVRLVAVTSLAIVAGCASIPPGRSEVDDVTVRGADQVDEDDIEEKIATTPSPRFLGLFQGVVYDYRIFNRFVLQRDLARVERYYRARGFYQARV